MTAAPDVASLAALIGDPARAEMLTALMAGGALASGELARQARVSPQTASAHLTRLQIAGLVTLSRQGRHRYYSLADGQVAAVLERLMGLADRAGYVKLVPGPRDPALRDARVCYDHLAGHAGVRVLDSLLARELIAREGRSLALTSAGERWSTGFGIDVPRLRLRRRALSLPCLDWSARRHHLAGSLGAEILQELYRRGWAHRSAGRLVRFSPHGRSEFSRHFRPDAPGI